MYYKEISMNSPCPCGSGKKHKKCCSIKTFNISTKKKVKSVHIPKTKVNLREFVLGKFYCLIEEATSMQPNDHIIQKYTNDLHNIKYKKELTKNEFRLTKSIALMNVLEYAQLSYDKSPDYGAMSVFFEFAYEAISTGVTDEKQFYSATVFVAPNDKLNEWEFTNGPGFSEENMDITWQNVKPVSKEGTFTVDMHEERRIDNVSTPYRVDQGLEEFVAGYLDLILMEIMGRQRRWFILDLIRDIKQFSTIKDSSHLEKLKKLYLEEVKLTLQARNADESQWHISSHNSEESVSEAYGSILFTKLKIVDYVIDEVQNLIKSKSFSTSKKEIVIHLNFAINCLLDQFVIEEMVNLPFIVLFVDEEGTVIDFTITESNLITKIEIVNLQEGENQNHLNKKEMSKVGKKLFKTAEIMASIPLIDREEDIDFSLFCLNFFTSLENELIFHYGEEVQSIYPVLKKRNLTIGKFTWAFKKMLLNDQCGKLNLSNDFLSKLEWARVTRNSTAHLNPINLEEYTEVKKIFLENKFIDEVLNLDGNDVKRFLYSNRMKNSLLKKTLNVSIEEASIEVLKKFENNVLEKFEAHNLLERVANHYFKVPFYGVSSVMTDRILRAEIDRDSLGYLLLLDNPKKRRGYWAHQFDYAGHNVFSGKTELHFGNMINNVRGKIMIDFENDKKILLTGNDGAQKMKLQVLSSIFKDSEDMYSRLKTILTELESTIQKNEKNLTVPLYYSLIIDFYLLIIGANENSELKDSKIAAVEMFLTIVLSQFENIQIGRENVVSVLKEMLDQDIKQESLYTNSMRLKIDNDTFVFDTYETTSPNEFILEISNS